MSLPTTVGRNKKLWVLVTISLLFALPFPARINAPAQAHAQPVCGAWAVVPTTGTPIALGRFKDVAATSPSNVWAIGTAGDESDLLARWDGAKWSVEPHPQPGSLFNDFQAIAASPDGDAWIVGAYSSSRVSRPSMAATSTLTQRLQGGRWKLIPSPDPMSAAQNYLVAVAPIGPDDVWAVGSVGGQDIFMRWNGTAWGLVPGPGTAQGGYLFDVAGAAPDGVWAVGVYTTDKANQAARILHWNGARWEDAASPALASTEYGLQGVAALSPTDAWAVGSRRENDRTFALIEHWDGSKWSVVQSPSTTQPENTLHRVVAIAPDDVWAVGRAGIGGDSQPLALHWDGTVWSNVALPRTNSRFTELVSVAVVPGSGEVWAVGAYSGQNGVEHTLAMRYAPCQDGVSAPPDGIPGMPSTGAGGLTLDARNILTVLNGSIAGLLAFLRHFWSLF